MTADMDAIKARYQAALDSKPSKGEWDLSALIDSVADVPALIKECEEAKALTSILLKIAQGGDH